MSTATATNNVKEAPVLLVSPNGVTRGYGFGAASDAARGTALAAAVAAAVAGDLVKMTCASTYHITAPLQPAEGVTLEGRGPQSTTILRDNNESGGGATSHARMVINTQHDDITLRGFSVESSYSGIGYDNNPGPGGGFTHMEGLLVENVWSNGQKDVLMFFGNPAAAKAVIRNCRFTNTEYPAASDLLIDLTLATGALVVFENCYISGQNDADVLHDSTGGVTCRMVNCQINGTVVNNSGTFQTLNTTAGTWDGTFTRLDQPAGITLGAAGKALLDDTTAAQARTTLGLNTRTVVLVVGGPTDDMATGDGQSAFVVPAVLNGATLTGVVANVCTAGTTGTATVAMRRTRSGSTVDVLSSSASIASTALTSTGGAINGSYNTLATGDILLIDVDAVHTTKAKGLQVSINLTL